MAEHNVAEAKNHLSQSINRSPAREPVATTRHGHPVVELKPVRPAGHAVTPEDMDWLAAHRVGVCSTVDSATLLSRLRDEEQR
jgi:antitoxin (DNA-binding transcriptional repressor) of toxin-antitoxin stability system